MSCINELNNNIVEKRFNKCKKLFIVNMGETDYDYFADYKYDGDIMDIAREIEKVYKKSLTK